MYKLKDIISSGGTNPKINKAINRYELSKDEKKDIISTIKTNVPQSGGSGGGGEDAFYFIADSMIFLELGMFCRYIKNSKYVGYKPLGDMLDQTTIAGAIFPNDSMIANTGDYNGKTVSECLAQMVKSQGFDNWKEYLSTAPGFAEITKEEFYTI